MVKQQKELVKNVKAYLEHLAFIKMCYDAYTVLIKNINEHGDLLEVSVGFFTVTRYALSKCMLIEMAKLYCGSGEEKTINKLIRCVKSNLNLFSSPQNIVKLCDDTKHAIDKTCASIIYRLKTRRDQDLTHNDPKWFDGINNPAEANYISPNDFEYLFNLAYNFCSDVLDELPVEEKIELYEGCDDLENLVQLLINYENIKTN